ncbi:MAG: histidine kinase [Acidobacteriaceae bacterium]
MHTSRKRSPPHRWKWIAVIWSGFGLIAAMQTVFVMRAEGMHHAWVRLFFTTALSFLPWALVTGIVMRLGHRFPPVQLKSPTMWGVHLATCIAISLVLAAWSTALDKTLDPYGNAFPAGPFVHVWLDRFYNSILASLVLYATILAASYVLDSKARLAHQQTETARLNEQLSKAQLDALRRQIEPHFLFNSLNSIAGLVREQRNDAAVGMIAALSDLLRRALKDSTRQQVPLGQELEFTQKYLHLQKTRFVERLQFTVDVPRELLPAQVPTLILQLMVENAIKHGISRRAQGGTIRIAASRVDDRLTMSVYNDGPAVKWESINSGIGMANMKTRLESLYGDGFALKMQNHDAGGKDPGGVEVSVSLPFRE